MKQSFPHRAIRTPIFVYYSWVASYMRQPNYVGFSKTVTYTTIEPNFDERTASDLRHLKVLRYKPKFTVTIEGRSVHFFVI